MGQTRGQGSLQSLSQGSRCQMGCTSRGSPPTMSLHGEPTMPALQQDSSWTPPGNICFRLDPPQPTKTCQGQSLRRMLVLPCLFSGFLSRLLQDSNNTAAARNTPSTHDKDNPHDNLLHREVLQLWGPSLMPQPGAQCPWRLQETPSPKAGQDQGTQQFQLMSPVCVKLAPINAITTHDQQQIY